MTYATADQVAKRLGLTYPGPKSDELDALVDSTTEFLAAYTAGYIVPDSVMVEAHLRMATSEWGKAQSMVGAPADPLAEPSNGGNMSPVFYSRDVYTPVRAYLSPWVPDVGFGAGVPL